MPLVQQRGRMLLGLRLLLSFENHEGKRMMRKIPNNRLEPDHVGSAVRVGSLLPSIPLLPTVCLPRVPVAAQPERSRVTG